MPFGCFSLMRIEPMGRATKKQGLWHINKPVHPQCEELLITSKAQSEL